MRYTVNTNTLEYYHAIMILFSKSMGRTLDGTLFRFCFYNYSTQKNLTLRLGNLIWKISANYQLYFAFTFYRHCLKFFEMVNLPIIYQSARTFSRPFKLSSITFISKSYFEESLNIKLKSPLQ